MRKYQLLSGTIVLLLLLSIVLVFYNSELYSVGVDGASGRDLYVDATQRYPDQADGSEYNPYQTIKDAIAAANDGDVIRVLPGRYAGDIVIDKSVTITNADRPNTILDGGNKIPYMIDITASSVSLEGFTILDRVNTSHRKAVINVASGANDITIVDNIINSGVTAHIIYIEGANNSVIKNNTFQAGSRGIKIVNSNLNSVYENYVENCSSDPSLKLVSSYHNHIEKNEFRNSEYGVYAQDSSSNLIKNNIIYDNSITGILSVSSSSSSIIDNSIYRNSINGIQLGGDDYYINNNTIYEDGVGIYLDGVTSYCNISDCVIYSCSTYGIYAASGSHDNVIFNNTFSINGINNARDDANNQWDNGIIGNYWDDFYGPDPDDANCILAPGSIEFSYTKGGVSDNYPVGIFNLPPQVSNPNPGHLEDQVSRQPTLKVDVVDPDPTIYKERLDVHFYYIGLDSSSNYIGTHSNVESGGTASKWFSSTTSSGNPVYSYRGLGYDYFGIWYVEVEDQYYKNTSDLWIFSTVKTPVNDKKPIIDISVQDEYTVGDEIHAQINDEIQFDASGCTDPDGEIVFYKWTFPPDTNIFNQVSPTHKFKSAGTYIVNLIIIDNNGSSSSSNITTVIESSVNRAPSAIISAPAEGFTGDSIQFTGSGSSDPDTGDSIAAYHWDFNDGTTSADENPKHSFSSAGQFMITLTVTDQSGENGTATASILIKSKSDESPGYEAIFIIITMIFVSIIIRRKRKN